MVGKRMFAPTQLEHETRGDLDDDIWEKGYRQSERVLDVGHIEVF